VKKIKWPNNKKFAFTIIDDTDHAYIKNIKPVYDLLRKHKIFTTKTIWTDAPRDNYTGDFLRNEEYCEYILGLKNQGFEIAYHGAGSGSFNRDEIKNSIEFFNQKIGCYPKIHINHANNPCNLYWGKYRFSKPILWMVDKVSKRKFFGNDNNSKHFWADIAKEKIKFFRNYTFNHINTLQCDPQMPYLDPRKPLSNFWFSSSDGHNKDTFVRLLNPKNIDLLEKQEGLCIVYTHFASGFVDEKGDLNNEFKHSIEHLAKKDAWFAPASKILEYLLNQNNNKKVASSWYLFNLDILCLKDRIIQKFYQK
jgi:hypothetical protein